MEWEAAMGHLVLLGDSIFDNAAYVGPGEPAVIEQVRTALPAEWDATLLAVDGSVTDNVASQVEALPAEASHLVVSAGGNDALGHLGMLNERARSVAEVFERIATIGELSERSYTRMLDAMLRTNLPIVLCTVYYPNFPDRYLQRLALAGLPTFNDVILRGAVAAGLPVVDLRLIFTEPADYANPIEPSARGGEKLARVLARAVTEHDFAAGRTVVYF